MPVILLVLILGYLLGRLHHARRVTFLTRRVRELTALSDDLVTDGHVRDARYAQLLDRYHTMLESLYAVACERSALWERVHELRATQRTLLRIHR